MTIDAPARSPSEVTFALRACCLDAPAGVGFVEIAGEPGPLPARDAPIVVEGFARPAYEANRATAYHEGAHALAALVAGGAVDRVTLREPNPKAYLRSLPQSAHPVVFLAGPHAEAFAGGWFKPIAQDLVLDHLDRVAIPAGGFCDLCIACRSCVAKVGLDNREEALRLFRKAERATVDLIDHDASRRFLRSVAHELLRDGELPGVRVHEIFDLLIDPSTLADLKTLITLGE